MLAVDVFSNENKEKVKSSLIVSLIVHHALVLGCAMHMTLTIHRHVFGTHNSQAFIEQDDGSSPARRRKDHSDKWGNYTVTSHNQS